MKEIHFGKGRPSINYHFEWGDGTAGAIDTASFLQSSILKLNHLVTIVKLISPTTYALYMSIQVINQVLHIWFVMSG